MKYTTKRSKVEEITIDLEDGCVIKLTSKNITKMTICPNHFGIKKTYSVYIELCSGINLSLDSVDMNLSNDLSKLFGE